MNSAATETTADLRRRDWAWALALGTAGLVIMGWMALAVRPAYLAFCDCVPYLVQAHIFQNGHLTHPAPPQDVAEFFKTSGMMRHHGREFSRQPPGASAMFALLTWVVREVRLAPPLLSTAAIVFNFLWIRRVYDRRTAVLATALCLSNPLYMPIGASVLSYAPSGLMFSLAMCLFVFGMDKTGSKFPALAGLFIGLQFATRPFTAILAAGALIFVRGVWFRNRPGWRTQARAFVAGAAPGIALLLVHNYMVTDHFWPLAFTLSEPNDRIGFGLRGLGPFQVDHTPTRALANLLTTARTLGEFAFPLYLWAIPLVFWCLQGVLGKCRSREKTLFTRWDASLALVIGVLICGHMLYWAVRTINYFETCPLIAALIARGCRHMLDRGRLARWSARVIIAALMVFGAGGAKGWVSDVFAAPAHRVHDLIDRTRSDRGPLLVFVGLRNYELGSEIPVGPVDETRFVGLFNYSLSPNQPVLYAADLGLRNRELAARFPTHQPYVFVMVSSEKNDHIGSFRFLLIPLEEYLRAPSSQPEEK